MPTNARKLVRDAAEERLKESMKAAGERSKRTLDNQGFLEKLVEQMTRNGFGLVSERKIKDALVGAGLWGQGKQLPLIRDGEHVFNRGIDNEGRPTGKSNFFVFVNETSKGVLVFFSDPDARPGAGKKELFIPTGYWGGDVGERAAQVMKQVLGYAAKKPETEFRAVTHQHWGRFVESRVEGVEDNRTQKVQDDGAQEFQDVLRMMILYHMDVDMSTPHNALQTTRMPVELLRKLLPADIREWPKVSFDFIKFLRIMEEGLGIVKVPGTELTMSLHGNNPNGPHMCIWVPDDAAAAEFTRRVLSRRDPNLHMQSFFFGREGGASERMSFGDMRTEMYAMMRKGTLAAGVAHPVHYGPIHLAGVRLPFDVMSIGLLSSVQSSGMELDTAENLAGNYCQAVGCWNTTVSESEAFPFKGEKGKKLREFLTKCMDGHNMHAAPKDHWAGYYANTLNMAFAEHIAEKYGVGTMFDGDDHRTLPMDYDPGGDVMGMGYTRLILPEEMCRKMVAEKRKMTPAEIVRGLVVKEVRMQGVVRTARAADGHLVIEPARLEMSEGRRKLLDAMGTLGTSAYAGELLDDLGRFEGKFDFSAIGNMPG